MKKKIKRFIVILISTVFIVPMSAVAFFSISPGDATLGAILIEIQLQTMKFITMIESLNTMKAQMSQVAEDLSENPEVNWDWLTGDSQYDAQFKKFTDLFPDNDFIEDAGVIVDDITTFLPDNIDNIWGDIDPNGVDGFDINTFLDMRDMLPKYSLNRLNSLKKESEYFSDKGFEILKSLENDDSGQATIRNAQASALQVHQLSKIIKNQGIQMGLQSQQVLHDNESQKQMYDISSNLLALIRKSIFQYTNSKKSNDDQVSMSDIEDDYARGRYVR